MWEKLIELNFGTMSIFEVGMLVCFAASWPAAIWKTIRAKNPAGKSTLFAMLVIVGYISGGLHKLFYKPDFVFWLYVFNTALVTTDLLLVFYYRSRLRRSRSGEADRLAVQAPL